MHKETLHKFYPIIIGLGLLVPVVSYLIFFAGSGDSRPLARGPGERGAEGGDRVHAAARDNGDWLRTDNISGGHLSRDALPAIG